MGNFGTLVINVFTVLKREITPFTLYRLDTAICRFGKDFISNLLHYESSFGVLEIGLVKSC